MSTVDSSILLLTLNYDLTLEFNFQVFNHGFKCRRFNFGIELSIFNFRLRFNFGI